MLKKIILGLLALIVMVMVAVAGTVWYYNGKIKDIAIEKLNANLNAQLTLGTADISLLEHFPEVTITLNDLIIVGKNEFVGDTLANIGSLSTSLDIKQAYAYIAKGEGNELAIKTLEFDKTTFLFKVTKNGKANWDITIADTTSTSEETSNLLKVALRSYQITNSNISYIDSSLNFYMQMIDMDHSGEGDFTLEDFVLDTKTLCNSLNITYDGISYLNTVKAKLDMPIKINMPNFTFQFDSSDLFLNNLDLRFAGKISMPTDDIDIDMVFATPQSDFKNLLSLIPSIYKADIEQIDTKGKFDLKAKVKGIYNDNSIPAYDLKLGIADGYFKYPDLPKAVSNIELKMAVANDDGIADHTLIDIDKFSANLGSNPFTFKLKLKNPETSQFIDAFANGKLDLSSVKDFYKIEGLNDLSGSLDFDIKALGSLLAAENKQFDKFIFDGHFNGRNIAISSKDLPEKINIANAVLLFNNRYTTLQNLDCSFGKSRLNANGSIENLLSYMFNNQVLSGSFKLFAPMLDLNPYMVSTSTETTSSTETAPFDVPDNINFTIEAKADEVLYEKYNLKNATGNLSIAQKVIDFKNTGFDVFGGKMNLDGAYDTKNIKTPKIDLRLSLKDLVIPEAFKKIISLQQIAPIFQFLEGTFSSGLSMNCSLLQDLSPDFTNLSGGGSLLIPNAQLNRYEPIQKLASDLNVADLKNIKLKNVNVGFNFQDGKIEIKPFTQSFNGIDMQCQGYNNFDKTIHYVLNFKIPREKFGKTLNAATSKLFAEAAKKGIKIEQSDFVNVEAILDGPFLNPKITTNLKETTKGLQNQVKEQGTLLIEDKKKEVIGDAKKKAEEEANKIMAEAEKKAQLIRNEAQKLAQFTKQKGYNTADSIERAATNSLTKLAAKKAADLVRKETDKKSNQIVAEADKRANQVLEEAKKQKTILLNKI